MDASHKGRTEGSGNISISRIPLLWQNPSIQCFSFICLGPVYVCDGDPSALHGSHQRLYAASSCDSTKDLIEKKKRQLMFDLFPARWRHLCGCHLQKVKSASITIPCHHLDAVTSAYKLIRCVSATFANMHRLGWTPGRSERQQPALNEHSRHSWVTGMSLPQQCN